MKTVVGLFDDLTDARDAVDDLVAAGFMRDDISLIASDQDSTYSTYLDNNADRAGDVDRAAEQGAEGALAGALTGGAIGGIAGVLLGIGAFAIPGVGPIIAAGPIAAGLTGAGIGAVVGGLTGALVSWGIPEEEAGYYAEGIRRGGTLVGVKADESRVDEAVSIMNDHGPIDVTERSEFWRSSGWSSYDPNAPAYTSDQVAAERDNYLAYNDYDSYTPTFRQHFATTYGTTGQDFTWYEPGYRYGYTLAGDDRYSNYSTWDELEADARTGWERTENATRSTWEDIKDSVRHAWESTKDAFDGDDDQSWTTNADRRWNSTDQSANYRDYDTYTNDYRTHYDTIYSGTGNTFAYYEPAYRFGHDLASDQYYSTYSWMDVEPEVRRHWEESNQGTWEEFKDAVRHGWNRVKDAVS